MCVVRMSAAVAACTAMVWPLAAANAAEEMRITQEFSIDRAWRGGQADGPGSQKLTRYSGDRVLKSVIVEWSAFIGTYYRENPWDTPRQQVSGAYGLLGYLSGDNEVHGSQAFLVGTSCFATWCDFEATVSGIDLLSGEGLTGRGTFSIYMYGSIDPNYAYDSDGPTRMSMHGTLTYVLGDIYVEPVPEASTWLTMLAGFGAIGCSARRRRSTAVSFS